MYLSSLIDPGNCITGQTRLKLDMQVLLAPSHAEISICVTWPQSKCLSLRFYSSKYEFPLLIFTLLTLHSIDLTT